MCRKESVGTTLTVMSSVHFAFKNRFDATYCKEINSKHNAKHGYGIHIFILLFSHVPYVLMKKQLKKEGIVIPTSYDNHFRLLQIWKINSCLINFNSYRSGVDAIAD